MKFGLIGKSLIHSFSKSYFEAKFVALKLDFQYHLLQISDIEQIKNLIILYPNLNGMNVTIPYKTTIIPYIDELNEEAKSIGAVNCIHIENKKWIGYNTDAAAFYEALPTHIKYKNALILGNGGAAKAVAFALNKNKIAFDVVSRQYIKNLETSSLKDMQNNVLFDDLGKCKMDTYDLIINCTPVGMSQDDKPFAINWKRVNVNAIAYDLIYNPIETQFLQSAQLNNISTINGLKMLHLQADKSFDIWMKQSQKNN